MEGLAYVTLDPDNGGIVSDISEGGLSFYSTTPVKRATKIRFWFSQRKYKMDGDGRMACTRFLEADSELAWTDETGKRGGLRFTSLANGDREEIRAWIGQHAPPAAEKILGRAVPLATESPFATLSRGDATVTRRDLEAPIVVPLQQDAPRRISGFAGGLATGVLVSAIVATAVLAHNHSREIGDSLIRIGQRLGGNPRSEAASSAAKLPSAVATSIPAGLTAPRPTPEPTTFAPLRVPEVEAHFPQRSGMAVKSGAAKPDTAKSSALKFKAGTKATPIVLPAADVNAFGSFDPSSSPALLASMPAASAENPAESSSAPVRPVISQLEVARQPGLHVEPSGEKESGVPPEEYLEVGKYNDKLQADKTADQLTQFGFPFLVVPKNLFWKRSYQVLAGPYASDHEAEVAHTDLTAHGFPTRPFERGKREVTLHSALTLGRSEIPTGDCVIRWESYVPNAMVRIEGPRGETVILEGKVANRVEHYRDSAVVFTRNQDGSRTLREFRFSGMNQVLVFSSDGTSRH